MSTIPAFPSNTWLPLSLAVLCFTGCGAIETRHGHKKTPARTSMVNLKHIGTAMLMYEQDNEERFPPMEDSLELERVLQPYIKGVSWKVPPYDTIRYSINPSLSRKPLKQVSAPAETVAIYEPIVRNESRGRLVAYVDGHAKFIPEKLWPELRQKSGIPYVPDEPTAPWWRFDIKTNRDPLQWYTVFTAGACLGLVMVLLSACLRLRYAPLTAWQCIEQVFLASLGYLIVTTVLGFVLGFILFFPR